MNSQLLTSEQGDHCQQVACRRGGDADVVDAARAVTGGDKGWLCLCAAAKLDANWMQKSDVGSFLTNYCPNGLK